MQQEILETEQFKADFAASGGMEFEELDEADTDYDLEQLAAKVQAARFWGA